MVSPAIKKAWEKVPIPLRRAIRVPLNFLRRLRYGWKGATVEVGGIAYVVDYASGTELGRARVFAELEGDLTLIFAVLAAQAKVILDVGANMGLYTLLAAVKNPDAQVYAIEPEPHNREAIARNLRANRLTNVTIFPYALGDLDTELTLQLEGLEELGAGTLHHIGQGGRGIPVQAVSLDSLIASGRMPAPQLIKMDIEGYELHALRGMQKALAEHKPDLLIEVHPHMLPDQGGSQAELEELLAGHGYCKRVFVDEDPSLERAWFFPRGA